MAGHIFVNVHFLCVVLACTIFCSRIIEITASTANGRVHMKRTSHGNHSNASHAPKVVTEADPEVAKNESNPLNDHADGVETKEAIYNPGGEAKEGEDHGADQHDKHSLDGAEEKKSDSGPKSVSLDEVPLPEKDSDAVAAVENPQPPAHLQPEKDIDPVKMAENPQPPAHLQPEKDTDPVKMAENPQPPAHLQPEKDTDPVEMAGNLNPAAPHEESGVDQLPSIASLGNGDDPSKLRVTPNSNKGESFEKLHHATTQGNKVAVAGGLHGSSNGHNGNNGHKNVKNENNKAAAAKVQNEEIGEADDTLILEVLQNEFSNVTPIVELDNAPKNKQPLNLVRQEDQAQTSLPDPQKEDPVAEGSGEDNNETSDTKENDQSEESEPENPELNPDATMYSEQQKATQKPNAATITTTSYVLVFVSILFYFSTSIN